MANKPTTIFEVGASSIKMVEALYGKDRIQVSNFSIIPLQGSKGKKATDVNIETLSALVGNEMVNKAYKSKVARGVVSGEGIISREVLITKVDEKELGNIIELESSQYFPVDLSNYVVDYKIITEVETNDGPKYKVYVVAVPQMLIDKYVDIAKNSKLDLEVIDINGNAFSKLIEAELHARGEHYDDDVVVGIDIGASASYIVFNQNGAFQFGREIHFGGNEIVHILSEYLALELDQASDMMRSDLRKYLYIDDNDSTLDEEVRVIGKDIDKILRGFAQQINKILEFYQARYNSKNIKRMFLTGGCSNIDKIDEFLTKNTGIKCEKIQEFKCVINQTRYSMDESVVYLTNVLGTAIRTK